jgi:hypothetical protein
MAPEHDLSRAREALDAYDQGREGTYGPYQVVVAGKLTQLLRGAIIEKQRPEGRRVEIVGPTVTGNRSYVGRMGWTRPNWPHCDQSFVRVIPDEQGWDVRETAFPATSIEEVA